MPDTTRPAPSLSRRGPHQWVSSSLSVGNVEVVPESVDVTVPIIPGEGFGDQECFKTLLRHFSFPNYSAERKDFNRYARRKAQRRWSENHKEWEITRGLPARLAL